MYLNKKELKRFKTKYEHAMKHDKTEFRYDGQDVVTGYAKYLIEYLESMTPEQYHEYEFKFKFDYMKKASNQVFVKYQEHYYIGCKQPDEKVTLIARILSDDELKELQS